MEPSIVYTFGNKIINSISSEFLENEFKVKLKDDNNENIPFAFPKINKSLCSCDKKFKYKQF